MLRRGRSRLLLLFAIVSLQCSSLAGPRTFNFVAIRKDLADQLAIAETTVNFHIKNLVCRLGANDRTHAVAIALRRGLLQV